MMMFFFFFSSRRRHTRFDCDWSSDVCSSDLAPGPGEQIVYQTIQNQADGHYHTFLTQVSGNAKQNWGDEIRLGAATTSRSLSHVAVSTQTFNGTGPYTPAFLEMRVWLNDGPIDVGGSEVSPAPQPGTLLATSRVVGPAYPGGGNSATGGLIVDFPLTNVIVPDLITVTIVNLNAQGIQDGSNPAGNNWGPFLSTGGDQLNTPAAGGPDYENSAFNTNHVGTSRTGPVVNRFTNNWFWVWTQANGAPDGEGWGHGNVSNIALDQTLYAIAAPTAANVYWDVDGANTAGAGGAGAPSGDWSGFKPNFNSNSTGTGAGMTKSRTTSADTVIFGGTTNAPGDYTVTVTGTQPAAGITVNEGNVTFAGTGTLSTGVFDVATGAT